MPALHQLLAHIRRRLTNSEDNPLVFRLKIFLLVPLIRLVSHQGLDSSHISDEAVNTLSNFWTMALADTILYYRTPFCCVQMLFSKFSALCNV